ncbi:coiled-coil and C2 domain-containing protein 1-like isoform X2 [Dendronephthya gigantea]|uniref:coiled-coil and C2 domain-containing protein 1-like isoform X2 n=1 Tax=Dendronephthya gigantea TaxID=151771 RepID=UPI001069295D|nr:coiled-coil and C2 domain-containing protein 1-like isoform X2 [Dendronephthya gigantea]
MFGQKKTPRPSSGQRKHDLGMFGIGMDFDPTAGMGDAEDDDDADFEAELAALQGGGAQKKPTRPKKKHMDISAIDAMAAECMKDVDDVSDDDDVNDADLMAELEGLSPMDSGTSLDKTPALIPSQKSNESTSTDKAQGGDVSVIAERKKMYEMAIASAEKSGEGGKARRYKRGLKEIEKMLKSAQNGKAVNMAELPPQVAVGGDKPAPAPTPAHPPMSSDTPTQPLIDLGTPEASTSVKANQPLPTVPAKPQTPQKNTSAPEPLPRSKPPTPQTKANAPEPLPRAQAKPQPKLPESQVKPPETSSDVAETVKGLALKRDQYKIAARNSNRDGDRESAKTYLLISKEFDIVIQAVKDGKEVDLSQCPPPPPGFPGGPSTKPIPSGPSQSSTAGAQTPTPADVSTSSSAPAPPAAPKTVLEALEQRLEKYQSGVRDAEKEGNSGKARRMNRILKQYQDAIRDFKAKKPLNLEDLPTPPGYPPFPTEPPPPQATAPRQPAAVPSQSPAAPNKPAPVKRPAPPAAGGAGGKPAPKGRNEKELQFLIDRQKEFKMAALKAKKQGDLDQARSHLKTTKGFDAMIEAARNGLRVDLTKVPESPLLGQSLPGSIAADSDFVTVQEGDCTPEPSGREETFASLEKALKSQYEMCKNNTAHYSKIGDLENSKRFEKLALNCKKDYDSLQSAFKHGKPPPRYHYENRTFSIVRSNTDMGDQDCEINIIKCINIPLPSGYSKEDMKVYVSYEFPFPNDQPQAGFTETVKHSINPEFQQKFKLSIDRKNRSLARIFRRQGVKFEIKYSRGFLKGDKSLGQAVVKLSSFDNRCEIHECVDLMDPEKGRKAIGGKIEVKIRIREPLTDKDVEILTQKWLVIEAFVAPSNRPISASSGKVENASVGGRGKSANVLR